MKICSTEKFTDEQKDEIIRRYLAMPGRHDKGSGHYLQVRITKAGNIHASYWDDGNYEDIMHHGEISLGKFDDITAPSGAK